MSRFDIKQVFTRKRAEQIGQAVKKGVNSVVPRKHDEPERWFFKFLLLSLLATIVLAGVAGIAGFMLTLQESEEVLVPGVVGKELSEGLIELQNNGLGFTIQERFYNSPESKGRIMEQDPPEGTVLKVGRKVTVLLSKGAVLNEVGDYLGRNYEQTREDLRATFGTEAPLIQVGNVTYVFDDAAIGTIISQEPAPGAALGSPVRLNFLVSKGRDQQLPVVPLLVGQTWQAAMETLAAKELPFTWTLGQARDTVVAGTVMEQKPAVDASLKTGEVVALILAPPAKVAENQRFGVYRKILPTYAVPIEITVQVHGENGDVKTLYRFRSLGGELSFPYLVAPRSDLVILGFDRVLDRYAVEGAVAP